MTSLLLARLGQLETRTATQSLWSSGKRKRGQDWVCKECRAKSVVLQQRRHYSDGSLGIPGDHDLFPPKEQQTKGAKQRFWRRGEPQVVHRAAWGVESEDRDATAPRKAQSTSETRKATVNSSAGERTTPLASQESAQTDLWERFEQVDEQTVAATDSDGAARSTRQDISQSFEVDTAAQPFAEHAAHNALLFDIDYATLLPDALLKREVDLIARCLFAASRKNDLTFIRSLSEDTFSQVLQIMEPANSIDKLASAHIEVSHAMASLMGIASMHKIAWEYSQIVSEIVAIRRSAGVSLTLADYAVLLRSMRDLGNRNVSHHLWSNMQMEGHIPDVECYNYYMATVIFDRVHMARSRHKLRIIPFYMMARKATNPGLAYRAYRTGTGGVKDKVLYIFGQMLKNGVVANEESFRTVIMAAAREGEMATVKSVLRKVWNIDVDALVDGVDESEISPKELEPDSPLYPTPKLLFTLAHAFGINNDIPTALRVVDFVARRYNLTIPPETWSQLFELTFVLATPRTGAKARLDGTKTGLLPLQSVMSLWETMTGPPYFVQPTMGMYNHLIKNLFFRDMTPAVVERMKEGQQIYIQSIHEARSRWKALATAVNTANEGPLTSTWSLERLRKSWELADLLRKRNVFWLKRWLRLLLATLRTRAAYDVSGDWALREIPRLLWDWRHLAPTRVEYETVGGIVEFNIRSQEEIDAMALRKGSILERQQNVMEKVPRLIGHRWLREGRAVLPKRLQEEGEQGETMHHWDGPARRDAHRRSP